MWISSGHYQAWATFLEQWGQGEPLDPAALPALAGDDFTGESWQRLADRLGAAITQRLQRWSDTLTRELGHARDEFQAAQALNHARWSLPPIRALAGASALPEEIRTKLTDLVDNQIRTTQEQLDAQTDRLRRSGVPGPAVEARLRTIRENPLTTVTGGRPATGDGWAIDPSRTPRRRIIVD
jgi:hypothetical protein